jgi:hypothetical protein
MSCKYSAEWWQKYELMAAASTARGEKTQPVRASNMNENAGPVVGHIGETDTRIRRRRAAGSPNWLAPTEITGTAGR